MAGARITIEPQGIDTVLHALQSLQQQAADLAPVMDDIGTYFSSETAQRFINEDAPDGTPWADISFQTRVARQGKKSNTFKKNGDFRTRGGRSLEDIVNSEKILTAHGNLRDSFTWNILDSGQTLEFGTNVIYAGIHQFGGPTGRNHSVNMPARPMLPEDLSATDEAEILTIVTSYLQRA